MQVREIAVVPLYTKPTNPLRSIFTLRDAVTAFDFQQQYFWNICNLVSTLTYTADEFIVFSGHVSLAVRTKLPQRICPEHPCRLGYTWIVEQVVPYDFIAIGVSKNEVGAKVGTSGKIFGSVTSVQVSRAIRDQKGYEIDRRKIQILEEIKELGTFKAKIEFGNGVETEIELEVISE